MCCTLGHEVKGTRGFEAEAPLERKQEGEDNERKTGGVA
jgi:hypothetical protein